jgi:hypothetical protein
VRSLVGDRHKMKQRVAVFRLSVNTMPTRAKQRRVDHSRLAETLRELEWAQRIAQSLAVELDEQQALSSLRSNLGECPEALAMHIKHPNRLRQYSAA